MRRISGTPPLLFAGLSLSGVALVAPSGSIHFALPAE
jgi:hypothetical protein